MSSTVMNLQQGLSEYQNTWSEHKFNILYFSPVYGSAT